MTIGTLTAIMTFIRFPKEQFKFIIRVNMGNIFLAGLEMALWNDIGIDAKIVDINGKLPYG